MGCEWWCRVFGERNRRLLDALVGGFRGRGKESECNCRELDALSGGFRGCGEESNAAMRFQLKR